MDTPLFHFIFQVVFIILALLFEVFDVILLMATVSTKHDLSVPFAYIIVMSGTGIVCKLAFITDFATYLVLPYRIYLDYRNALGKEFTLLGTLTYFIPMCVSALMTANRLFIVVNPTNHKVFSQKRIFVYSLGILVVCFTLLLIPYLSTCPVNFLASTLVFVTACAPDRHPVTRFTNINAIWVPTTVLIINTTLVIYLKATRALRKASVPMMTSSLAHSQRRREQMLTRQTVSITIYLSFYEVGSLLMRTFPETYGSLPSEAKDAYFYFRLETICAMNFFVYGLESSTTRKMIKKYMNFKKGTRKISTVSHHSALF